MTAWDNIKPFVFGGISGMAATTIIQPIDMIKVRVQLAGEQGIKGNAITLATKIIREQGFLSLYTGLSAGLLRQATYTTARMGLFNTFNKQWQVYNADPNPKAPATLFQKSISGLAAGGLGAFIGNPCDLVLIRMQSDGLQAPDKRQHYRGVGDAMTRIVRAEGVLALWKGATPTIVRAMSLNLGMLTTHAEAKLYFDREIGKGWISDFCSSAVAGFFASALSLPFDFVKTRLQKQTPDANGKLRYNGVLDCAQKVLRTEGPLAFYKGFPTYYLRIAPHAMITLLTATALNTFFAADISTALMSSDGIQIATSTDAAVVVTPVPLVEIEFVGAGGTVIASVTVDENCLRFDTDANYGAVYAYHAGRWGQICRVNDIESVETFRGLDKLTRLQRLMMGSRLTSLRLIEFWPGIDDVLQRVIDLHVPTRILPLALQSLPQESYADYRLVASKTREIVVRSWRRAHAVVFDVSFALYKLALPVYTLLWILDFVPPMSFDMAGKMNVKSLRLIESVHASCDRCLERRSPTAAAAAPAAN